MLVPVRARIRPEHFLDVARTRLSELEKAELAQDSGGGPGRGLAPEDPRVRVSCSWSRSLGGEARPP